MNIDALIETMLVLFIVIIVGYVANKKGILDKNSNAKLSDLVLKITSPALIISSVLNSEQTGDKKEIFNMLFAGVILYLSLILISKLIIKVFRLNNENGAIYELMLVFVNATFMGYPILSAIYGENAIFSFSILHMPFNILIYSYGVYQFQKDRTKAANLSKEQNKNSVDWKILINPGIISAVIALIIFLFDLKFQAVIKEAFSLVGGATVPISMMLIGSSLALIPLKDVFSDSKIYILSAIKLIVMPFIIYFLANLIFKDETIVGFLTVSAALPTASMIVMFANQYNKNIKSASSGVFITTILSIITIPVIISLLLI